LHEGHQDMLEWLGLDAGKDFDPKKFSVAEVNARLPPLTKARWITPVPRHGRRCVHAPGRV